MRVTTAVTVLAVLVAAVSTPGDASGQYGDGETYLGVHLGVSGYGSAPAFGVSGEVGYRDRVALGGWLDTWSYGQSFTSPVGASRWNVRYVAIAGTGAYHFLVRSDPRWDPFAGASLGYYVVSTESVVPDGGAYTGEASRLFVGLFGGVRYFFNESVAGVARLGLGAANLTLGVDFRM